MPFILLDHHSKNTLSRQIYTYYRKQILAGVLKSGTKLPSSRALAAELSVARNVVLEAYEQLVAEGYLYSRQGAGLYVDDGIIFPQESTKEQNCLLEKMDLPSDSSICFRTGIPDLGEIPRDKWASLYKECIRDISDDKLDYQTPGGNSKLRIELVDYLKRERGVKANFQQIIITTGAAQAFSLLCKLLDKDDLVITEEPLSSGLYHTITGNHIKTLQQEIDQQGIITSNISDKTAKMIFTSPSHQFPTGVTLPIKRRIELIRYAKEQDAYIVEDDYDSEFRYEGNPIQCMQALDSDHVIYVGTFSKTLMPALRIGYMVVPEHLIEPICNLKYVEDYHSSELEQIVLAEFIKRGYFERHIRRMKKLYFKKRNILVTCLNKQFGSKVEIIGEKTGLHLVANFPDIDFDKKIMCEIHDAGIDITAVSEHCTTKSAKQKWRHALLFGFGNTPILKIEEGIQTLASLL